MAKVRYHLGPQGPGVCRVDLENPRSKGCPFGGESGSEDHFATMAEAETAYADQMENSGNGSVAVAVRAQPRVSSLQSTFKDRFQRSLDELVADSSYGISRDPKLGYIADSSEGLERLRTDFVARSGNELEPDALYEPDSEGEVLRSIYIKELDIEIENQNFESDMQDLEDDRAMVASNGREYWR